MDINDILKLVNLTQAEINALTDKEGFYFNSDTGNVEFDGSSIGGGGGSGDMQASVYDPNNVQDDAFDFDNFLGTFQIPDTTTTVNLNSDKDNLDLDGFNIVNITTQSQDRRITGIKAPPSGVNRIICFFNTSSQFRMKFVHQSGSSSSNNRIVLRGSAGTRNLLTFQMCFAVYNHNINKWYITRMA